MDKEKQIKMMACDMCTVIGNCNDPYNPLPSCEAYRCAKRAVDNGYCKASEVAEEIFEEIDKLAYRFMNDRHYIFGDMVYDLAELKKKYTEGEG